MSNSLNEARMTSLSDKIDSEEEARRVAVEKPAKKVSKKKKK